MKHIWKSKQTFQFFQNAEDAIFAPPIDHSLFNVEIELVSKKSQSLRKWGVVKFVEQETNKNEKSCKIDAPLSGNYFVNEVLHHIIDAEICCWGGWKETSREITARYLSLSVEIFISIGLARTLKKDLKAKVIFDEDSHHHHHFHSFSLKVRSFSWLVSVCNIFSTLRTKFPTREPIWQNANDP